MFIKSLSLAACFLSIIALKPASAQQKPVTYANLTQGQIVHGFKVQAVYLNDSDKPMGGRFIDVATGFTLDFCYR